jgi:hypothetical protein
MKYFISLNYLYTIHDEVLVMYNIYDPGVIKHHYNAGNYSLSLMQNGIAPVTEDPSNLKEITENKGKALVKLLEIQ